MTSKERAPAGPPASADPVDRIMEVMEEAFDSTYGEAWNRRQVSDALVMNNCRYILMASDFRQPQPGENAAGFVMSRQAADEEELLLIAVRPKCRRSGIASALIVQLVAQARKRGVNRIFLEMREGNPAEALYRRHGFAPVGRRQNYYTRGALTGIDAITFALNI